jgi:hypothetical protein
MIQTPTGKAQTRGDVFGFEIRQLVEHLLRRQTRRQQIQHIGDADTEPSHAWTPPALVRVHSDTFG